MEFLLSMIIICLAGMSSLSQVFIAKTFADYLREKGRMELDFFKEMLKMIGELKVK